MLKYTALFLAITASSVSTLYSTFAAALPFLSAIVKRIDGLPIVEQGVALTSKAGIKQASSLAPRLHVVAVPPRDLAVIRCNPPTDQHAEHLDSLMTYTKAQAQTAERVMGMRASFISVTEEFLTEPRRG